MKKYIYQISLLLLFSFPANAQTKFHISQYMLYDPFINPAAIVKYHYLNWSLFNKNQWVDFKGAPKSKGFYVSKPVFAPGPAAGISILYDRIGVSTELDLSGTFAYKVNFNKGPGMKKFSEEQFLGFGFSGSLRMMQSDLGEVRVLDNGDPVFEKNTELFLMPNIKIGTYFQYLDFYFGISTPNIFRNSFIKNDKIGAHTLADFKAVHFYIYSGYKWEFARNAALQPSILLKEVSGAPLQFDLDAIFLIKETVGLGAGYRSAGEGIFLINYTIDKTFVIGYSYDVILSALGNYTSGTHEITLTYRPDNEKRGYGSTKPKMPLL